MTLDEAIKHAEEVVELNDNRCDYYKEHDMNEFIPASYKCAEEHRQLAEWLKDYKRLKEQKLSRNMEEIEEIINCDADAETKCKMISNILTAKPHYFEESTVTPTNISGDMVCPQVDGVTSTVISNDDSYYKFVKNYNDTLPPNVHIMKIELGKGESMTREEAKTVFLNRGYVEVEGGIIYDADKWREACRVISEWLEQEPCEDVEVKKIDEWEIQGKNAELWIVKGNLQVRYIGTIHNIPLSSIKPQEPTIPSADKTCDGCLFQQYPRITVCQECSRYYSDNYVKE